MKSDEIIELSRFKYELFTCNINYLKEWYFNCEDKLRYLNYYIKLINSDEGQYYINTNISNKVLQIISEDVFIKSFNGDEQLKVIRLIKKLLKCSKMEVISSFELESYQELLYNEYLIISSIINNQPCNVPIDYSLIRTAVHILNEYKDLFVSDSKLLQQFKRQIVKNINMFEFYFERIRIELYKKYMLSKLKRSEKIGW